MISIIFYFMANQIRQGYNMNTTGVCLFQGAIVIH